MFLSYRSKVKQNDKGINYQNNMRRVKQFTSAIFIGKHLSYWFHTFIVR